MLGIALNPTDVFYTDDRDYVVWLKSLVAMAADSARKKG